MKTILKTVALAAFVLFASTSVASAAQFNSASNDYQTVLVKNITTYPNDNVGWGPSVTANPGDTIGVLVYYHNTGTDTAQNVYVSVGPQTTPSAASFTFSGFVSATNAATVNGSASVTINGGTATTLAYVPGSLLWHANQTVSGGFTLLNGQTGTEIFSSPGLFLGSIAPGWGTQGTVTLRYVAAGSQTQTCPNGTVIPVGQTCPPQTQICPNGAVIPVGQSCPAQTQTCPNGVVIPVGQSCPVQTQTCPNGMVIAIGQTCPTQTQTCPNGVVIPVGQSCPTQTQTCPNGVVVAVGQSCPVQTQTCPNGTVISVGQTCPVVQSCPTGYYFTNNACWPVVTGPQTQTCPNGVVVAVGQSCPVQTQTCPNGTVVVIGQSCPSTYTSGTCPSGYYFTNNACWPSGSGYTGSTYIPVTSPTYYYPGNSGYYSNYSTLGVTTNNATNVWERSAQLNGFVSANNESSTVAYFRWGTTQSMENQTSSFNTGTNGTSLTATITNLSPGTTYYFQASAYNASSGRVFGQTLTFTTPGTAQTWYNVSNQTFNSAITGVATRVARTSAQLNGIALTSSIATNGYFEWGTTRSLGNVTSHQFLGSSDRMNFSEGLSSLDAGVTYYYRAVIINNAGTFRGDIMSFSTPSQQTVVYVPSIAVAAPVEVAQQTVTYGRPAYLDLIIEKTEGDTIKGTDTTFRVTYRNVTNKTLQNVLIKVTIPEELMFQSASRGTYAQENKTLTLKMGDLARGEEGTFAILARTLDTAQVDKVIAVNASGVYTLPPAKNVVNAQEEVTAYVLSTIREGRFVSTLPTVSSVGLFSGVFLPTTLLGWLFLLVVLFIFIILIRNLMVSYQEWKEGNRQQ